MQCWAEVVNTFRVFPPPAGHSLLHEAWDAIAPFSPFSFVQAPPAAGCRLPPTSWAGSGAKLTLSLTESMHQTIRKLIQTKKVLACRWGIEMEFTKSQLVWKGWRAQQVGHFCLQQQRAAGSPHEMLCSLTLF